MKWLAGMTITADRLGQGAPTDVVTYTPTVINGGTATWATQIGYYTITDNWVEVVIYLVAGAGGSGAASLNVTMPTNVDRSTRQTLLLHAESCGVAGNATSAIRNGQCVFLTGGSGAISDRMRVINSGSNDNNIQGMDVLFGANTTNITVQGRYRKA